MRYLIVLAAICGLLYTPTALAGTPVIYVANTSTVVPQTDIDAALPAFQTAVSRDLASVWGVDATLTTDPAVPHDMSMIVSDDANCLGCLGYHDTDSHGHPIGFVFARTSQEFNESWQLVFTHELFEMLVDPVINRFAVFHGRTWLVEVADQVESGFYAYSIDGVVISDFITPAWFGSPRRGPFDFTGGLKRAGQVGRHGYASYWTGGGWKQIFG